MGGIIAAGRFLDLRGFLPGGRFLRSLFSWQPVPGSGVALTTRAQKKLRGEMINELKGVLSAEQFQQLETSVHHTPPQAVPSH
jgi:hypothetical protein